LELNFIRSKAANSAESRRSDFMEIWDSHVHLFPPEIYENWEKYAPRDPWFATLTRKPENGKGTEEAWCNGEEALASADEAGVSGLVMQGWYWNDAGLQTLHNDYMAELLEAHPQRLRGFISLNPLLPGGVEEVERCLKLGFSGIGELGPGGNGYDFRHPKLWELLECADHYALPVCIHCGEPVGHPYPGKDTTSLAPLPELAKRFPHVTFVLAHLGGGLPFYELNRRIRKAMLPNVVYDTAANPLLYDLRSIRAVVDLVGADRLLFGSDFPLLLYPSKSRERDMTRFVTQMTQEAGLTGEELSAVMGGNLRRILKLP
jgi:hypothetical protein